MSGTIISSSRGEFTNPGSLTALVVQASGTISGTSIGIYNATGATIATLSNNGTISGGFTGIYNATGATITTLSNSGSISGVSDGINNFATITALSNSGAISGRYGIVNFGGGSTNALNNGTIATLSNTGTISASVSGINNSIFATIDTLINAGTISGTNYGISDAGAIATLSNEAGGTISGTNYGIDASGTLNTLINAGTITGGTDAVVFNTAGLLVVDAGAVFNGNVVGGGSTLELGTGSSTLTGLGTQVPGFNALAFTTGNAWDVAGTYTAFDGGQTISGFAGGDTITLDGFTATSVTLTTGTSFDTLSLSDSTTNIILDFTGSFSPGAFSFSTVAGVGTDIFLCYMPGTRLLTPTGETMVEALRAGDLVMTTNGPLPVRWIGMSHVSRRFADPLRSLPIRITKGALGDGLPVRDLLLSPDHAVYMHGVLVQAGALVNNETILRDDSVPEAFTYYHVELASHELLFAEGVPAESFVDNLDRMHFHNWDERVAPSEPIPEMPYPRAKSQRQLPIAVRRMLARQKVA